MPVGPTMFCWRCNKPVSGQAKCPECGTSLRALALMKRLGWVAVVAGAFVVILMVAIWAYIAQQSIVQGAILCDAATRDQFLGRIYIAFALVVLCGLLAIANGIRQIRSGIPNWIVTVAIITLFIGACVIGANGANACNPS